MGSEQKLSGPDLSEGIALAELSDRKMLLGHAAGEAVLLARQGDQIFAVGATCTHYSGPLAEGLLAQATVRCPWHHGCFDLRTGAAVPPALNAIPCYEVVREGERVRVGRRLPRPNPRRAPPVRLAGSSSWVQAPPVTPCETLRDEGYRGQLLLLGADAALPVDRPNLSKDYLAGSAPEEWLPLRPREFFEEHGIELALGERAVSLDTARSPRASSIPCSSNSRGRSGNHSSGALPAR